MKLKRPIYRYLFFAGWLALLGGITSLVIAANGKAKSHTCQGVDVTINADGERMFVQKADVLKTVYKTAKGSVVKKPFAAINLGEMERNLEKNAWIRDAELYFDTKDRLQVAIWERQPIARVFNTAGASFYIDSAGFQLPLLHTFRARLPVVTGFTAAKKTGRKDSLTLQALKDVIRTITADEFWNAQIGQIDITPEGKFEAVPVVGSHIIKLGYGNNVSQKLANLLVFYKQVLPVAGLAKYSALDLQFDGQVVAVRKGPVSKIDSIQLQKNIDELVRRKAAEQEPDEGEAAPVQGAAQPAGDSAAAKTLQPAAATALNAGAARPPVRLSQPVSKQQKPAGHEQIVSPKKPKAIMRRRET